MNVIDKAADRLRGHWTQGTYEDKDGNVCLAGAIPVTDYNTYTTCRDVICSVLEEETGSRYLWKFNDDPATTEEDVLLVLKKASARYDEIHGATS